MKHSALEAEISRPSVQWSTVKPICSSVSRRRRRLVSTCWHSCVWHSVRPTIRWPPSPARCHLLPVTSLSSMKSSPTDTSLRRALNTAPKLGCGCSVQFSLTTRTTNNHRRSSKVTAGGANWKVSYNSLMLVA